MPPHWHSVPDFLNFVQDLKKRKEEIGDKVKELSLMQHIRFGEHVKSFKVIAYLNGIPNIKMNVVKVV